MKIVTDSLELEEPKDPSTCNVFNIYKLIASDDEIKKMETNYMEGGLVMVTQKMHC